jgi:hypothetical protein
MSFIRTKNISGKDYAYLVSNKWYKRKHKGKNKGPRQKVSKYLGRVYSFDKVKDTDFYSFRKIKDLEGYLKKNSKYKMFRDLVEWEVFRHNINKEEFTIDYSNKKVINKNTKKEVSLGMNGGFLCSFTLSRLLNLGSGSSHYLAKAFVEAGIEVPQELFVGVFGK